MPVLPIGTITFLFTDIEGSTRLWDAHPEAMRLALARHDALLRQAIEDNTGIVFKTIGDAFCAAFATAPDALRAALTAQQALHAEVWLEPVVLKVRMALHTGMVELRDNDYFGQPLNRIARLLAIGHGGQVLISAATQELTRDNLPATAGLKDAGEHRLRDLGRPEAVSQLLHPDLPSEFPPLKSLDNPEFPNNLPQQVTSFIGREKETESVKSLLSKTRLLTLTGSGGCGKTRLALQVGADVLENYADGAWLVELAPLADPTLLPHAIASVLGVREEAGKALVQTLIDFLKVKHLLLVLDNCEHLLTASAQVVDTLIRACPNLKILASSREGLGIAGELTYRIPSLSLPDPRQTVTVESVGQYEAVQLFIERALFHLPSFALTNANAPALASICHRLDGIPLAIELSAARVRSLSVEEINSKLDNRFRLLTGGSRTALPRQQTLRALIDWSYDLLNDQEKTLLCRLCVFVGGWTLEAAEQVCTGEEIEEWEVLDLLTSLADKSLVVPEQENGQTRYRLLETVRQYGRDRLAESGESEAVRQRHQDFFLALAEAAEPNLLGAEQAEWLNRLEAEHENLRAALDWSAGEKQAEESLRLCGAMWRYWTNRGHLSEGREYCAQALETAGAEERSSARAQVLNRAGYLASDQGDYVSASAHHEESLAIRREIGERRGIAHSLNGLGTVAYEQGNYAPAQAYYKESLAIYREIEEQSNIAISLNNLGNVAYEQGDYASARAWYEGSLVIQREIGDQSNIAISLSNLGNMVSNQGDSASARDYLEESLAIRREIGERMGIAHSLSGLGSIAQTLGDYASAQAYYEEGLAIYREIGERMGIALMLNNLASIAYEQGEYAPARAYQEESLNIQREIGDRKGIAGSLCGLGKAAYKQGEYASARAWYEESLTIRREIGDRRGIANSLEAFACLAARESRSEQAIAFWGAAETLRTEIGAPLPPKERDEYERKAAGAREALGEDAFSAAWAQGRAMTLEQVIDFALQYVEPDQAS